MDYQFWAQVALKVFGTLTAAGCAYAFPVQAVAMRHGGLYGMEQIASRPTSDAAREMVVTSKVAGFMAWAVFFILLAAIWL